MRNNRLSDSALITTSGPIPFRSPIVIPILGFSCFLSMPECFCSEVYPQFNRYYAIEVFLLHNLMYVSTPDLN